MIYIYDEVARFTREDYARYRTLVPMKRLEKVKKYRAIDRTTSMLAYLLLRYAFLCERNRRDIPEFQYADGGKPYIRGEARFNLSHCCEAVMCGIADTEIGVDIQEWRDEDRGIANMVFSEAEVTEIEMDKSCRRFFDLWTLKESYGKFLSCGIGYDLKSISFERIYNTWLKRYACSLICGRGKNYSYAACAYESSRIIQVDYRQLKESLDKLL